MAYYYYGTGFVQNELTHDTGRALHLFAKLKKYDSEECDSLFMKCYQKLSEASALRGEDVYVLSEYANALCDHAQVNRGCLDLFIHTIGTVERRK